MAIFFWMRVIELRIWHQVIFGQSMWKEYNRMTANIQMSSIEFFNRLWIVGWSSKILSVFFICCQPGDSITLGIYIYPCLFCIAWHCSHSTNYMFDILMERLIWIWTRKNYWLYSINIAKYHQNELWFLPPRRVQIWNKWK